MNCGGCVPSCGLLCWICSVWLRLSGRIVRGLAIQVMIRLVVTDSQAVLQIQDNGKGFTVPDPVTLFAADGHFGLLGIREWVEMLKGEFELFSQPGAGTRLCVRVPLCSDASR